MDLERIADPRKNEHTQRIGAFAAAAQLVDQTVSLSQLKLQRDKHGRVRWVRTYTFDVSPDGVNRAQGSLTFTADRVEVIELPEGFDSASSKRPG